MTTRTALLLPLTAGLLLAQAGPLSAQINPADMRSGALRSLAGTAPETFFTVPAGSLFVLTDIVWSTTMVAGDQSSVTLILTGDSTERWRMSGGYRFDAASGFQSSPFQSHFTTGLVFQPGEVLSFQSGAQLAGRSWILTWSGYLVASSPASAGETAAPSRPAMLGPNSPNPVNPTTEIRYTLSSSEKAVLRVYDAQGRHVRSLLDKVEQAGVLVVLWDGRDDSGRSLASGVYYYELTTERGSEARRAVLLK